MLFFLIHIDKLFCVSYKYFFLVDSGPRNFFKTKVGHDYKRLRTTCLNNHIKKKCSDSQYFVRPPLFLITALIPLGILLINLWQCSLDIYFTQTSFIAFTNSEPLNGCFSDTLFFMLVHKFSMGLKSGLFPGHLRRSMLLLSRKFFATLKRWEGTRSCINI